MDVTNDQTLTVLRKGLDAMSARQAVIANNVANVETPNYKAIDVAFEDSLRRALQDDSSPLHLTRTSPQHLDRRGQRQQRLEEVGPAAYRRNDTAMRKDGNNVDVDIEMVQLAETALRYQAMSTLASKKLALLRMVAQESR